MARFYANENFPLPVVEELWRRGHDVLTTQEAGNSGNAIPDSEVLAFAVSENRSVLTFNRRHFVRLHEERPDHAGIVVCTFDPDFARLADRIHAQIEEQSDLTKRLVRVNRPARS